MKTLVVDDEHIVRVPNVGYNIFDIAHFITNHYDNLPDLTAFAEGWPFDHIKREIFDKLIFNTCFTALEDYLPFEETYAHKNDVDGGYLEINNSWYLQLTESKYNHQWYNSYDEFMTDMFSDYKHLEWIRFAPGAQYIVPKENILKYSLDFWKKLMGTVGYARLPLEAQLIERTLYYIFNNTYTERPIRKNNE